MGEKMGSDWEDRRDAGLERKMEAADRKSRACWHGSIKRAVGFVGGEVDMCPELLETIKRLRLEA